MSNIIEIHQWLRNQTLPNENLPWNHWDNIHTLLKSKIGKTLYTKSCWADIPGLYKATLYDENMTIKIGNDLKEETIKKRGNLTSDTYKWLTIDRIFVDNDIF